MGLIAEDVGYTYARGHQLPVRAVDRVTLTIEPGTLTLVLGATGSGKSTLMRLLAGLLAPTEGSVRLDGAPLTLDTSRGVVGMVFQEPESQLFADTLLDDVAFGPRNLGASAQEASERALQALEAVGLRPDVFAGRSPFSLSGGEARRAAIAGVLAMEPRYLLADEPTAGLDAKGRRSVRRLLEAQREHAGIVIVSHAAEEFLGEADQLVVLAEGSVAWSGTGQNAIDDPSVLACCGVRPPDVLEVQRLAVEHGMPDSGFTLDPSAAAERLIQRRAG